MNTSNRPNIYQYHDFTQFLNDWLAYLRKVEDDFSLRNLAKKSNIALGYINMILKKERAFSEKAFYKITPHLNLSTEEQKFFNLLRILGQSEDSKTRLDTLDSMMKFKKFKMANIPENRTYEYLTKWYYVAIYEMFNLDSFQMDALWIQKKLNKKLGLTEIEQAISFLKKHHFVKQNPNGTWSQTTTHLDCTEGIYKISLAELHKQMLDLAHEAIHSVKREERLIMGQTMAVNKENFEQIKQIIQQTIKLINEINKNSTDKDNVYHVEIAAFPLLKSAEEK